MNPLLPDQLATPAPPRFIAQQNSQRPHVDVLDQLRRYSLALLLVLAATLLRWLLHAILENDAPLIFYYAAIAIAALLLGFGPGVFSTCLSVWLGTSLFIERDGWQIKHVPDQILVLIFLLSGICIAWLAGSIHSTRQQVIILLENMPDVFCVIDSRWRFTYVNSRWVEVFGLPASRVLGQTIWDLFPKLIGTEIEQHYRRVMSERVSVAFEAYSPYAQRWMEIRAYPTCQGIAVHLSDISTRKASEQAVRASERRYRALVRATPQVVWSIGMSANDEEASQWWTELTGQSPAEASGWGWLDVVHPEDRDQARAAWQHALDTRTIYDVEYRVRTKSGTYRRLATRGVPLFDDQGNFLEWIGTITDVQPREDAATALRLAEERLRLAIQAGELATWDWDLVTNQVIWSEQHYHLLGYPVDPSGLANYSMWKSRVHPDDLPTVQQAIEQALQERSRYSQEYRIIRADNGEERWLYGTGQILTDPHGQAVRMVGVLTDITARRRATEELAAFNARLEQSVAQRTEELARSEARFRTLFEHTPVAVWEEDFSALARWFAELRVAGITDLRAYLQEHPDEVYEALGRIRVLDINREAVLQNGAVDKSQLLNNLPLLFTERSAQTFVEELVQLWEGKRSLELETCSRRLDGRIAEIVMRLQVPGDDDNPDWSRVIVTGTDVTERARVEEELRRARTAAEAANRAKSEFLANMSHEIRTPMNGVLGMTELLLDTPLSAEQKEYLGIVKQSTESLLSIIDDILDFSKIEAGKLLLAPVEFALRDELHRIVQTMNPSAQKKNLRLNLYLAPELPEVVIGDSGRLRQVLINLIGNAIKFTPTGSVSVRVALDRDNHNGSDHSSRLNSYRILHFQVSDTGIGIPADKLSAIFLPFEQAENSMSRRFGGTGLGLTISARLVELMGGRIWAESQLGQGSTFHFTVELEVSTRRLSSLELPTKTLPTTRSLRVLLAEDNPINQRVALGMLEILGHQTTLATNGQEVLDALERQSFDVILMDVQMPNMDGITTTKLIREREQTSTSRVPIIALTAHAMQGDRERFLAAGMDAYISKPVRLEEMRRALAKLCQSMTPLPPTRPVEVIHCDALLQRACGKPEVAARVLGLLPTEGTRLMNLLREAVQQGDLAQAKHACHTLKGMLSNLSAGPAEAVARTAEEAAKRGETEQLRGIVRLLEAEMTRLLAAAEELRQSLLQNVPASSST